MKNQVFRVNESPLCKLRTMGFLLLAALILTFPTCKKTEEPEPDPPHQPGVALNPKTYPGKNRIQVEWQNNTDPKVIKAKIFWDNNTESVEVPITAGMTTVSKIIEPLQEKDYSFKIRTYDAEGNESPAVEVNGKSYGTEYEKKLKNRTVESAQFNIVSRELEIIWAKADATEVEIQLEYKDVGGAAKSVKVEPSKTLTTITDFKEGEVLSVTTKYKPASDAIDVFSAAKAGIPYELFDPRPWEWVDISDKVLKNYRRIEWEEELGYMGFQSIEGSEVFPRDITHVADWKTNEEGRKNGNVWGEDNGRNLILFTSHDYGYDADEITNGKLWQTVELEAGTYMIETWPYRTFWGEITQGYFVVSFGDEIPDVTDVENDAIDYIRVYDAPDFFIDGDVDGKVKSLNFTLTEKKTVSIGYVVTMESEVWMAIEAMKLFQWQCIEE